MATAGERIATGTITTTITGNSKKQSSLAKHTEAPRFTGALCFLNTYRLTKNRCIRGVERTATFSTPAGFRSIRKFPTQYGTGAGVQQLLDFVSE